MAGPHCSFCDRGDSAPAQKFHLDHHWLGNLQGLANGRRLARLLEDVDRMRVIHYDDPAYPATVRNRLGTAAPPAIYLRGEIEALSQPMLGLICSVSCPGSVIIKTYDMVRSLRSVGVAVAGGFHSPMEHDCFELLLRGPQVVVLCPAQAYELTCATDAERRALQDGRLLVVSIFGPDVSTRTGENAAYRNDFVAALVDVLLVPYANHRARLNERSWARWGAVSEYWRSTIGKTLGCLESAVLPSPHPPTCSQRFE
jgi:predicted Rossmann fold nucleotide-binding protein DprA/Smf involved in DNA uptake